MLLKKTEQEIRQELYDDPKGVTAQLESIYHNKDDRWSKAYWNKDDPQHEEAVQRVSILAAAKIPGSRVEVMPVITSSEPNEHEVED